MISILQEISKWKEMAIDGLLSNKSLMKLTKAGIRKPVNDYLAGVDRGTENILNKARTLNRQEIYDPKTGFKIFKQPQLKINYTNIKKIFRGHSYNREGNNLTINTPNKHKYSDFISKRHEANEALQDQLALKKYNLDVTKYPQDLQMKQNNVILGTKHLNPFVLKNEGKDSKQLTKLYPHLKNQSDISNLMNYRNKSGEDIYFNKSNKEIKKQIDNVYGNIKKDESLKKYYDNDKEIVNLKNQNNRYNNALRKLQLLQNKIEKEPNKYSNYSTTDQLTDKLNKSIESINNKIYSNIDKSVDIKYDKYHNDNLNNSKDFVFHKKRILK